MRKGPLLTVVIVLMSAAWAVRLASQAIPLAEVAKAEEARRKAVKNPTTKVYTNDDLKGTRETSSAPVQAAPAAATPAGAAETKPPAKPEPAKPADPNAKDEKYWRSRVAAAQQALDRSKLFADSLQTRINSLTTDFVNMDDPAKRSAIETQRKTAVGELDRVKKEIEAQTKAIADIQEEARKANVPPGWLR